MTRESVIRALGEYEEALRSIGAGVVRLLRPGARVMDLDAGEERAGFRFPQDARAAWTWHNGSPFATSVTSAVSLPPGNWFPDLDTAVDRGREQTETWVDALGEESGYAGTKLLAFHLPVGSAGMMTIDCADPDAADVPAVRLGRDGTFTEADRQFTVTDTVRLWTGWILDGAYVADERGFWNPDEAKVPRGDERHQF